MGRHSLCQQIIWTTNPFPSHLRSSGARSYSQKGGGRAGLGFRGHRTALVRTPLPLQRQRSLCKALFCRDRKTSPGSAMSSSADGDTGCFSTSRRGHAGSREASMPRRGSLRGIWCGRRSGRPCCPSRHSPQRALPRARSLGGCGTCSQVLPERFPGEN